MKEVEIDGRLTECCLIQVGLTCSDEGKDGLGIWLGFDVAKAGLGVVPKD